MAVTSNRLPEVPPSSFSSFNLPPHLSHTLRGGGRRRRKKEGKKEEKKEGKKEEKKEEKKER